MGGVSYAYDGDGNRVSRSLSGTLTRYLLDTQPGLTVVLAETTGANTTRYIHGSTGILAQQNPDSAMRWMLQDGLQSVRAISDGMNVLSAQAYSPYGEPMYNDLPTEFGFTGEQIDSANDVVYLRARVMNPKLGIFGSLDPLEGQNQMVGSLNRYNWVRGNVVNLRDANGMCPSLNPLSPTPQPIPLAPNSKYATPSATPNAPVQVTYEEVPTPEGTDDETAYGEIETNSNDYLGVFYAKTPIKDRLDFKSSLHQ